MRADGSRGGKEPVKLTSQASLAINLIVRRKSLALLNRDCAHGSTLDQSPEQFRLTARQLRLLNREQAEAVILTPFRCWGINGVRFLAITMAAMLSASAASAQTVPVPSTPRATARAVILLPLTLTKVDDLDFGTLVPSATGGTVRLDAVTSARTVTGGVTLLASVPGKRALLSGSGSGGQRVVINLTAPPSLTSPAGDTIDVGGLTLDGSVIRTIDATTHSFAVGVGGTLFIKGNQPDGVYSSTFDITAEYL